MFDLQTVALVKDLGALAVLLCFLIWFARNYLNSVAAIAKSVNDSTLMHIQVLNKISDSLGELSLQVMRNSDVIVKCHGPKGASNERPRN